MHGQERASTLMSIRDAARASGLSPKALRRRIERGTLGSVLVGGRRRIPVDDLVRRGLVAGPEDPVGTVTVVPIDAGGTATDQRLRALEARVTALEAALRSAGAAPSPASAADAVRPSP